MRKVITSKSLASSMNGTILGSGPSAQRTTYLAAKPVILLNSLEKQSPQTLNFHPHPHKALPQDIMSSEDVPPPPYVADTATQPINRPPPFPLPSEVTAHFINLIPGSAPFTFAYPEPSALWLSRDIQHEDWAAFTSNLVRAGRSDTTGGTPLPADLKGQQPPAATQGLEYEEQISRMREELARWDETFFKPRGMKVVSGEDYHVETQISSSQAQNGSSGGGANKRWNFGPDKFGFQIGGALLGIDMSKPATDK
ncbi:hypothetical protein CFRS1_v002886 [Colletotrichum fructicola]|nr:hypothetical protein CFRS1_v002886 [Colletotrichum fructicola]